MALKINDLKMMKYISVLLISILSLSGWASEYDSTYFDSIKNKAGVFLQENNVDSALYYYSQGATIAEEEENWFYYSANHYNLAMVNMNVGNYIGSIDHALKAYDSDKEQNDQLALTASANLVAAIYDRFGFPEKAIKYQVEAIEISEQLNDKAQMANSYSNMGNIYKRLGKDLDAKEYFDSAQRIYNALVEKDTSNTDLLQGLASVMYANGQINQKLHEYTMAEEQYKSALEIWQANGNMLETSNAYNVIGQLYFQQNEWDTAQTYFMKSFQYKLLVKDMQGVGVVLANIANANYKKDNLQFAEVYANKSMGYAKKVGDKETMRANYELLYKIYHKRADYKKALLYHKMFFNYHDSVYNEQSLKIFEEASKKYQAEKKEKENLILQHEVKMQSETNKQLNIISIFSAGVAVLVFIILIILFFQFRKNKKTNLLITAQNEQLTYKNEQIVEQKHLIEEKNKDLTDSLFYAKKIQQSMLADNEKYARLLKDVFILLQPKDIVSGDFYWLGQLDNKVIVAAIDCTGHGVPGAFMSMLGDSYLNQIVYVDKITDPAQILDKLNQHIREALNQKETNNQDGMDMSLCSVDVDNGVVEWAGAKNPLVVIQNGELVKMRADSKPIGGFSYEDTPFTKHTIEIGKNAYFYMFSDGFQDQFGGPKNKKFMVKRLQKLLLEIHNKPMSEQKDILLAELDEWKGKNEQIDDVVVLGFRV